MPGSVPGSPQQPSMNLPFPFPHGKASIVKLFDVKDGDMKLNDLLKLLALSVLTPPWLLLKEMKRKPPSLVPRLHVLSFSHLADNKPLLSFSGPFPPLQKVGTVGCSPSSPAGGQAGRRILAASFGQQCLPQERCSGLGENSPSTHEWPKVSKSKVRQD